MRVQRVLLAVAAALVCLGASEAIKCYSCVYAPDAGDQMPPGIVHNEKCGDSFDETMMPLTSVNETNWEGISLNPVLTRANSTSPVLSQTLQQFSKMFGASKSSGVNAGSNKVFCAKGTADAGTAGTILVRGFFAEAGVTENMCGESTFLLDGTNLVITFDGCICDTDECNSAAELKLSFALIAAVAVLSKLMY